MKERKDNKLFLFILIDIAVVLLIAIWVVSKLKSSKEEAGVLSKKGGGTQVEKKVSSLKEVEKLAAERLKNNLEDKEGLINLLGVYLKKQDLKKAEEIASKLLKLYPEDPKVLNNIATFNLLQGKIDEAEMYLKKALEKDPKNTDALYNLANLVLNKGKVEKAYQLLKKYFSITSGDAASWELMGKVLLNLGKYEEAYKFLSQAYAESPQDVETLLSLVEAEFNLQKFSEAKEQIQKFLQKQGSDWRLYRWLGLIYLKEGDMALAYSTFDKGYELIPDPLPPEQVKDLISFLNDYAYLLLQAYNANKNEDYLKRAEWMFRKVLSFAPDFLPAMMNLAVIEENKKNFSEAEKIYRKILSKNDRYISALVNLGLIMMNIKKDYETAQSLFKKALSVDPQNMALKYNYALTFYFLGDKNKAVSLMEEVVRGAEGTPLSEAAKKVIQKIKSQK